AHLVGADEPIAPAPAGLGIELEPRAEKDARGVAGQLVDDDDAVEALAQVANSPIDLGELAFAVDVFGVLRAVALRGRLGDRRGHGRTLRPPEVIELGAQSRRALGSDVLRARRRGRSVPAHRKPETNVRSSLARRKS